MVIKHSQSSSRAPSAGAVAGPLSHPPPSPLQSPLATDGIQAATTVSSCSDSESSTLCVADAAAVKKKGGPLEPKEGNSGRISGEHCNSNFEPAAGLLRETERCFLQRDYRRSLLLVHRYFENDRLRECGEEEDLVVAATAHQESVSCSKSKSNQEESSANTILLVPSIRIPLSTEKTTTSETRLTFVAELACPGTETRSSEEANTPPPATTPRKSPLSVPASQEAPPVAIEIADQLAVIGLQSWYELSKMERKQQRKQQQQQQPPNRKSIATPSGNAHSHAHRWSRLLEILEYYKDHGTSMTSTNHPERGRLSMELLATVWLSFWECNGYEREAFAWTLQYLHCSYHSRTNSTTNRRTMLDELWLRCVCQQITSHLGKDIPLATKILDVVTNKRESPLDKDAFEGIWKEIESTIVATECNGDKDENKNDALMMHTLIERIDLYLDSGKLGSDTIDDANAPGNAPAFLGHSPPPRHACVSRRTMVQARQWLAQEQEKRLENEQGKQLTGGEKNALDEQPQNHQTVKESQILPQSPSPTDLTNKGLSFSPTGFLSESSGPTAVIRMLQNAWKSFPRMDGLPKQALIAVLQALKTLSIRLIPDEIRTRVLRLVSASFAFVVSSEPTNTTCSTTAVGSENESRQRIAMLRQHLQQALLSMVLFWAGWRGRRLLLKCGRAVVSASLAPIRELLEALGAGGE